MGVLECEGAGEVTFLASKTQNLVGDGAATLHRWISLGRREAVKQNEDTETRVAQLRGEFSGTIVWQENGFRGQLHVSS